MGTVINAAAVHAWISHHRCLSYLVESVGANPIACQHAWEWKRRRTWRTFSAPDMSVRFVELEHACYEQFKPQQARQFWSKSMNIQSDASFRKCSMDCIRICKKMRSETWLSSICRSLTSTGRQLLQWWEEMLTFFLEAARIHFRSLFRLGSFQQLVGEGENINWTMETGYLYKERTWWHQRFWVKLWHWYVVQIFFLHIIEQQ